jgi:hypothetical protein
VRDRTLKKIPKGNEKQNKGVDPKENMKNIRGGRSWRKGKGKNIKTNNGSNIYIQKVTQIKEYCINEVGCQLWSRLCKLCQLQDHAKTTKFG